MQKIKFFAWLLLPTRSNILADSQSNQPVEATKAFLPSFGSRYFDTINFYLVLISLLVASISYSPKASAQSEIRCSTASVILSKDISKMRLGEKTRVTSYIDGKRSFFESPPKTQALKLGGNGIGNVIDFKEKSFFVGGDYWTDCWVK